MGSLPQFEFLQVMEVLQKIPTFNPQEGVPIRVFAEKYKNKHNCDVNFSMHGFMNLEHLFSSEQFNSFLEVTYDADLQCSCIKPKAEVATPTKKKPPPAPSISGASAAGSTTPSPMDISETSSEAGRRRAPPAPPSIDWSDSDAGSIRKRVGRSAASSTSKRSKSTLNEDESMISGSVDDRDDVISLAPDKKRELAIESSKIYFIPRDLIHGDLTFDKLILLRRLGIQEPSQYVDATFCDSETLRRLMDIKYDIKKAGVERFLKLREKMDNYNNGTKDPISFFHNGDALKMANMDALLSYALSNPKKRNGEKMLDQNEILYFADILGGPGGHAEYFLWKLKWECKGFGYNPIASQDFPAYDLPPKHHYCSEAFEAFYDLSLTVNIFNPESIDRCVKYVKRMTYYKGVHLVICNGGEGQYIGDEDQKEIRCKGLFIAELWIALQILRDDGNLILKIYDIFTPFTAGLVYLIYRCFDMVAIYKPETATPASAERFIIAKFRKGQKWVNEIADYLSDCYRVENNASKMKYKHEKAEITQIVPIEMIKESATFLDYLRKLNEWMGNEQLEETADLLRSIRQGNEEEAIRYRLFGIREKALNLWKIPKEVKKIKKLCIESIASRTLGLLKPYPEGMLGQFLRTGDIQLSTKSMAEEIVNPRDWHFVPVGKERGFYLSMGGKNVYKFVGGKWEKAKESIELANNTLVYADIMDELKIHQDKQEVTTGFHIIDAIYIGGKDVRDFPYNERADLCHKFAKAMNKSSRNDLAKIRMKYPIELPKFKHGIEKLELRQVKSRGNVPTMRTDLDERYPSCYEVSGLLLIKTRKDTTGGHGDFMFTLNNRVYWEFGSKVDLDLNREVTPGKTVHAATLVKYVAERIHLINTASSANKNGTAP